MITFQFRKQLRENETIEKQKGFFEIAYLCNDVSKRSRWDKCKSLAGCV